jgi:hypothetical protein
MGKQLQVTNPQTLPWEQVRSIIFNEPIQKYYMAVFAIERPNKKKGGLNKDICP